MKTLWIVVSMILVSAFALGQAPTVAVNAPTTDVYVGGLATFPDYGPSLTSYRLNGAEIGYAKGLTAHLSLIASATGQFGTNYNATLISVTAGAKYNLLVGRVRPYVTVQGGLGYLSSDGMYASDHHPPKPAGKSLVEDGFSYRMGGGVDFQLSRKIYWRVASVDLQPQPWGRHTPYYVNVGSGFGYRF